MITSGVPTNQEIKQALQAAIARDTDMPILQSYQLATWESLLGSEDEKERQMDALTLYLKQDGSILYRRPYGKENIITHHVLYTAPLEGLDCRHLSEKIKDNYFRADVINSRAAQAIIKQASLDEMAIGIPVSTEGSDWATMCDALLSQSLLIKTSLFWVMKKLFDQPSLKNVAIFPTFNGYNMEEALLGCATTQENTLRDEELREIFRHDGDDEETVHKKINEIRRERSVKTEQNRSLVLARREEISRLLDSQTLLLQHYLEAMWDLPHVVGNSHNPDLQACNAKYWAMPILEGSFKNDSGVGHYVGLVFTMPDPGEPRTVRADFYNSLHGDLPESWKITLSNFFATKGYALEYVDSSYYRQRDGVSCGIFSIYNLFDAINEKMGRPACTVPYLAGVNDSDSAYYEKIAALRRFSAQLFYPYMGLSDNQIAQLATIGKTIRREAVEVQGSNTPLALGMVCALAACWFIPGYGIYQAWSWLHAAYTLGSAALGYYAGQLLEHYQNVWLEQTFDSLVAEKETLSFDAAEALEVCRSAAQASLQRAPPPFTPAFSQTCSETTVKREKPQPQPPLESPHVIDVSRIIAAL